MKTTAIVLSAGKGSRMKSNVPKQYLQLSGYPIIYYSLKAFQDSFVDEIILVCGESDIEYCRKEIVERYGFSKVVDIVAGGKERYNSVYNGLQKISATDYVYIHDGARPFITEDILMRVQKQVEQYKACVVGMPVKDTIKIVDDMQNVSDTPERKYVWQVQTPQVFSYELIMDAYKKLYDCKQENVTDDAMVVEQMTEQKVHLVEGSYENIKITTPEDIEVGMAILQRR